MHIKHSDSKQQNQAGEHEYLITNTMTKNLTKEVQSQTNKMNKTQVPKTLIPNA